MEQGDVAMAISYSGETKEVIKCAENAKKEEYSSNSNNKG